MSIKKIFIFSLMVILLSLSFFHYSRGYFITTINAPFAYSGNIDAMFNMSIGYRLRNDSEMEMKWLHKAAEKGDGGAMYNLGLHYEDMGRLDDSIYWLTSAANTGRLTAMYNLGLLNHKIGNKEESIKWYTKSAEGGFSDAIYNLGLVYYLDGSVDKAASWFKILAEQKDSAAQDMLGSCLLINNPKQAAYWFEKSYDQGNLGGMMHFAKCCMLGLGIEKDFNRAISILKEIKEKILSQDHLIRDRGLPLSLVEKSINQQIELIENAIKDKKEL